MQHCRNEIDVRIENIVKFDFVLDELRSMRKRRFSDVEAYHMIGNWASSIEENVVYYLRSFRWFFLSNFFQLGCKFVYGL